MPLCSDDYRAAFELWPPEFGPERSRFGYKQIFLTVMEEGEPVRTALTGLHKNGWWIGARVVAANKQRVYDGVEVALSVDATGEEWSQMTGEWAQMEPVSANTDAILSIDTVDLPAGTTLAVRLCFYYTK